ncbi:MAG: hypothetical protein NWR30_07980 [Salibacteraceae bacterium]|nr:hypothetical protein [Salibacteraceae bacterium]
MSFAENLLKTLFARNPKNELKLDSGKLTRTEAEIQAYQFWKTEFSEACLAEIARNFKLGKLDLRDDLKTVWFKNKSANGFHINLKALKTNGFEPWFLLQYFQEATLALGYRKYTSDFETREIGGNIYRTERVYLKPQYVLVEEDFTQKVKQLYGNILMELTFNKGVHLKLLSTIYFDRNFTEALPFDQYLEETLSTS